MGSAKFVLQLTTQEQKETCLFLNIKKTDENLKLSWCDEIWLWNYDAETKQQSSRWKSLCKYCMTETACQVCTKPKWWLIDLSDYEGAMHYELVCSKKIITAVVLLT